MHHSREKRHHQLLAVCRDCSPGREKAPVGARTANVFSADWECMHKPEEEAPNARSLFLCRLDVRQHLPTKTNQKMDDQRASAPKKMRYFSFGQRRERIHKTLPFRENRRFVWILFVYQGKKTRIQKVPAIFWFGLSERMLVWFAWASVEWCWAKKI